MKADIVEVVKNSPSYKELVAKRSAFGVKLAVIMLVMYYAFILVIAFDKKLLGISLSGGVTTVGIPVGIGIIVFSFILTGIYTKRANSEFDELSEKVKEEVRKAGE